MMLTLIVIIISLLFFRRFWAKCIVHPYWWPYLSTVFDLIMFLTLRYYYYNWYVAIYGINICGLLIILWMAWAFTYFAFIFLTTLFFVHDGETNYHVIISKDWVFYHPSNLKKPDMFEYNLTMIDTHARFYIYLFWLWLFIVLLMTVLRIIHWIFF